MVMATLDDRIRNPKFNNWVKSALTLDFARDALKEFVESENKTNHEALIKNIQAACSSCSFETSSSCQFKSCSNTELSNRIRNAHFKKKPSFGNTNPKDCWSQPWEFAKCFMPSSGYQGIRSVDETDFPGLISLIVNNWDFKKCLQATSRGPDIFIKAKEVRNKIMHNPTFEVDERKFMDYTDVIKEMLNCIPFTEKTKSSLSRIDELNRGTLTISAGDISRVIKDAIALLQIFKREINHSISNMTDFTEKLEDTANKSFQVLEFKVKQGVITIERTTNECVRKLDEQTEFGLECIKKGKSEAADELSCKQNAVVEAISSTATGLATQLQMQMQESKFVIQNMAKTEYEAIKHEKQKATDEIRDKAEQTSIEIQKKMMTLDTSLKHKMMKLDSDKDDIIQKKFDSQIVRNESFQNEIKIHQSTDTCVNTLRKVTTHCIENLRQQFEEYATFIRESKYQPGNDILIDTQKIRQELSDALKKVNRHLSDLKSETDDTKTCMESIRQEHEKLSKFIRDSNTHSVHDKQDVENRLVDTSNTIKEVVRNLRIIHARQRKTSPFKYLNIELEDEVNCSITGMVKISLDNLAIVDSLNNRVKIINVLHNTITAYIEVLDPFDITCVNNSLLVVTCRNALQFLELNDETFSFGIKRVQFEEVCGGIDYSPIVEQFAVSFEVSQSVRIIDIECNTLHVIQVKQTIQWLSITRYIKLSNDGVRVYVTDDTHNSLLCLSIVDGTVLQTYEYLKLNCPRGLAVDIADNVYTVGFISNNIHKISPDGSHASIFLDGRNGIERPSSIAYCNRYRELYVSHMRLSKNVVCIHQI